MEKNSLYQVRDFGEKFNATFDFFKQTWKTFFRFSLYVLLPLALLMAVGTDEYYSNALSAAAGGVASDPTAVLSETGPAVSIMMVASIVATAFIFSLAYGLMKCNYEGFSLDSLTFKDFWQRVQGRCFKRTFNILLFGILLLILATVVVALLAAASPYTLIVTIPALVVFLLPLSLWSPIYLIEDDTHLIGALRKSYRYGMKTWGSLFVLALVMTIIVYMVSFLFQLPSIIMLSIKALAFPQLEGFGSMAYTFVTFIVTVAGTFFSWIAMQLYLIAFGYHYGSAAEKIDNVTAANDIARFDEMGDNNADDPALEPKRSDIDDFEKI